MSRAAPALRTATVLTLLTGGFSANDALLGTSAVLAVAVTLLEWRRLLPLARVFVGLAALSGGLVALVFPEGLPRLWLALVQGVSFSALMMVLGMLRQPARRSGLVRQGVEYLLAFEARRRYAAVNVGSQFLSILFNVGMVSLIGDLAHAAGRDEMARRSLVVAGMRGAALVSIWSPIGVGFAIVSSSIPALNDLQLMATAFLFTAALLLVTSLLPILPAEVTGEDGAVRRGAAPVSARPLLIALGVCACLIGLTVGLHLATGVSFTLASVCVLPVFASSWLWLETRRANGFRPEILEALAGLGQLRSESAIFLSASVIGAAISLALSQAFSGSNVLAVGHLPVLPVLLAGLISIPLASACFVPNSILVVVLAQVLGPGPIGTTHPLALGLTLTIAWATAIATSPISAMCLLTASHSGVSSRRVAWKWNGPFALLVLAMSATFIAGIVALGG